MPAARVGAKVDQGVRVGRPVPDDVVGAAADLRLVVAPRDGIGQKQLAFRKAEGVALENFRPNGGRDFALVQHRPPGDVAGIVRHNLRQELLAHRGAHAIGGDEQVCAKPRAVGKDRADPGVLLDVAKRHAEAITLRRQQVSQRAIEPSPRAHDAHRFCLEVGLAAAVEENERVELNPHRLVEIDPDAPQYIDELRMRAQPGAAAREVLGIALEHKGIPAGAAQEMCGEQPAERAADHQSASRGHYWDRDARVMPWPKRCCRGRAGSCGSTAPDCGSPAACHRADGSGCAPRAPQ